MFNVYKWANSGADIIAKSFTKVSAAGTGAAAGA
jgi:hypothetical protein